MKTKRLLPLFALFLTACSSKPAVQASYYLLYAPENQQVTENRASREIILLKTVRLADYLEQDNLALQVDTHQLYLSRQHLWAEKLQHGMTQALLSDINKQLSEHLVISSNTPISEQNIATLVVEFDHFVATNNSSVIASGRYWLTDDDESTEHVMKSFVLKASLTEDGFPHSVAKLRGLISDLSKQISQEIE